MTNDNAGEGVAILYNRTCEEMLINVGRNGSITSKNIEENCLKMGPCNHMLSSKRKSRACLNSTIREIIKAIKFHMFLYQKHTSESSNYKLQSASS